MVLEGCTLGSGLAEPSGNFVGNRILSVSQSLVLAFLRRVEVNAVSAAVALDVGRAHCFLGRVWMLELGHCCKLPGVLAAVEEEDVVTADVQATIVLVSGIRACIHFLTEDALAVVGPERFDKSLAAHRCLIVWCLIEAKLVAVLVGPLTTRLIDVDFGLAQRHRIVVFVAHPIFSSKRGNGAHQGARGRLCVHERLAHRDTIAVLDTRDKYVGEEEPKVARVDGDVNVEEPGHLLDSNIRFKLVGDVGDGFGDGLDTLSA